MNWANTRTEQLVLGALLTGQPLCPEASHLRATDFYHPVARQLYSDITRLKAEHPQWGFSTLAGQIAPGYDDTLISAELLRRIALRSAETQPQHLDTAVKMVLRDGAEAAISRDTELVHATHHGQPIPPAERAAAYSRLGEAVARRTVELQDIGHYVDGENDMVDAWYEARGNVAPPERATMDNDQRRDRQNQERTILAGLLKHPNTSWVIGEWLPDEVFTTYSRRNIYRALTETVDPAAAAPVLQQVERDLYSLSKAGWNETPPENHRTEADRYELTCVAETAATTAQLASAAADIFATDTAAYLAAERQRVQQQRPAAPPAEPQLDPPTYPGTSPSTQPKP